MKRLPIWTMLVVIAAIVVQLEPSVGQRLVFDRDAIGAGELWRLIGGNLVHFSWPHLVGDLTVVATMGWIIERRSPARAGLLFLGSMIVVGCAVLALEPEIRVYGGLSGVAHGTVALLALSELHETGRRRWLGGAAVVAVAAKLAVDFGTVRYVAVGDAQAPVVVVATAHWVAACYALVLFLLTPSPCGRATALSGGRASARATPINSTDDADRSSGCAELPTVTSPDMSLATAARACHSDEGVKTDRPDSRIRRMSVQEIATLSSTSSVNPAHPTLLRRTGQPERL